MEFASQISISEQQDPWPPTPALGSLLDACQPSTFACRGQCCSFIARKRATYYAVDKLQVARTLSIAVSSTVLGTGLVVRVLSHATVFVHRDEVQCAIQTAREVREIDIKRELLVQQTEHLVRGIRLHEIQSRANVSTRALRHKRQLQRIPTGCGAVSGTIICALESAVGCACLVVLTESGVPRVACVAIGVLWKTSASALLLLTVERGDIRN